MHPMIKEVNSMTLPQKGSGAIGDFHMSYSKLKAILDDKEAEENYQGWYLHLWNGMFVTIYPEDYDNVETLERLQKTSRWHIGLEDTFSGWGNRWGKVYSTIMHYILQDGIKGAPKTDEHDVIRMVLTAKDT